jgi:hypothetical protein
MTNVTFNSTGSLHFLAELLTGIWADTILTANISMTPFQLNAFTPTHLEVLSGHSNHIFTLQEDPGDPFLVIRVTNMNGDLEVRVPGQAFVTIPANTSTLITYPRVSPLVKGSD